VQDRTPVGQGVASTTLWVSLFASTLAERWVFDMVIFRLVRGHLAHGGVVGWRHRRRRGEKRSVARSSGRRGGASAAAGGLGGSSSHLHGQISDPIGLRLHIGVCWGTGDDGSIGETRKSFSGGRVGLRAKMEEEQQIFDLYSGRHGRFFMLQIIHMGWVSNSVCAMFILFDWLLICAVIT
jgi:hypothetical protein